MTNASYYNLFLEICSENNLTIPNFEYIDISIRI